LGSHAQHSLSQDKIILILTADCWAWLPNLRLKRFRFIPPSGKQRKLLAAFAASLFSGILLPLINSIPFKGLASILSDA
jgi:hypothetical protein